MESRLIKKFDNIIHYSSEFKDFENGGLINIKLKTFFKIEINGMIKIDIWATSSDFYSNLNYEINYRHQTEFELKKGEYLNRNELLEMFRFTEDKFLNTLIMSDKSKPKTIKEIFKLNEKYQKKEF